MKNKIDAGKHYRFQWKGLNLDPFRIARIYGMQEFEAHTILKKVLCAGNRGHKDKLQDVEDIICAAERWKAILLEDSETTKDFCENTPSNFQEGC